MEHIKQVKLQPGEAIISYDVKAPITSLPVDPSIQIVQQKLTQDTTLPQRTSMSIPQMTKLLEFCLKDTYFLFQGKYYEQVHGAVMGSPISYLITNLYMEEFEVKALNTNPIPPLLVKVCRWHLCHPNGRHSQQFLHHINTQDPNIQFTVGESDQHGSLPFLDTKVTPGPNNTLSTTV